MKAPKIMVAYDHDPASLSTIELGFGDREPTQWFPALRDTYEGRRVVWVRSHFAGQVWLRDRDGVRKVRSIRL